MGTPAARGVKKYAVPALQQDVAAARQAGEDLFGLVHRQRGLEGGLDRGDVAARITQRREKLLLSSDSRVIVSRAPAAELAGAKNQESDGKKPQGYSPHLEGPPGGGVWDVP